MVWIETSNSRLKNIFVLIKDSACDLNFSEMLLEQRQECLKFQKPPLFSTWFLVTVVLIILAPFVILGFWYTERRQKILEREMHNNLKTRNELIRIRLMIESSSRIIIFCQFYSERE